MPRVVDQHVEPIGFVGKGPCGQAAMLFRVGDVDDQDFGVVSQTRDGGGPGTLIAGSPQKTRKVASGQLFRGFEVRCLDFAPVMRNCLFHIRAFLTAK